MASLIAVLVIAVLILLNGLFVAAEFAIVGAPRLAIERRARGGQRVAQVVRRILDHPGEQDRFIATAQIGITFASLGLGMYGEHVLAGWIANALEASGAGRWIAAHAVATVISVTVLTYFHIVVGEMVPKSLALQQAERTVLWITPPMLGTQVLFYPLVIGLNRVGNAFLRLIGMDRQTASATSRPTSCSSWWSQEAGTLPAVSGRLLHEIFEFGDLSDSAGTIRLSFDRALLGQRNRRCFETRHVEGRLRTLGLVGQRKAIYHPGARADLFQKARGGAGEIIGSEGRVDSLSRISGSKGVVGIDLGSAECGH